MRANRGLSRARVRPALAGLLAALALGPAACGGDGGRPAPAGSPGFVVIVADDLGWAGTSVPMLPEVAEGACAYLETPSLERLAREGMRFGHAYAPAPLCTPTRRSLLCGMNPARQRGTEFESDFDPSAHLTVPTALKAVDPRFRCAHFGKWGELMGADPASCGYDESDGPTITREGTAGGDSLDAPAAHDDPKRTFSVTQRALDFLDRRARDGAPFYLQVSSYAVHRPVQARPGTLAKYKAKGVPPRTFPQSFAAMTEDLDAAVGLILQRLDDPALRDRTWVVFTSDNGGTEFDRSNPLYSEHSGTEPLGIGRRGEPDRERRPANGDAERLPVNHPLRGSKQRLYEGGIRVPLLVRGPGVEPGSVCRTPVVLFDLLPTLVDLAGGTVPEGATVDGATLRGPLESGGVAPVPRAAAGLTFHRPELGYTAYREGDHKLVVGWGSAEDPRTMELYDVVRDPGESADLSAARPELRDAMYATLLAQLEAMGAEAPEDRPARP